MASFMILIPIFFIITYRLM